MISDKNENKISCLLVADAPGHILERIGQSWVRSSHDVNHEVICSYRYHPFSILRYGKKFDVTHWVNPLIYTICANATAMPQIVMIHHLADEQIEPMLALIPYADAITTVSEYWKRKLEYLTCRDVLLIPNTVDIHTFAPRLDRIFLRQKAGINDNEFVIGFVGKAKADAYGRKGIDVLLEIIKQAGKIWQDLSLILVGPGWEFLATKIEAMGIRVLKYEFDVSEKTADIYPLMDVLLVTSSVEGGPCTILEAMACGTPVVTSNVGHVPEVVTDGQTGFICPTRTPKEYIEKIRLLKSNYDLRLKIAIEARKFIERERAENVIIPQTNFVHLYSNATEHFYKRPIVQRRIRLLGESYLRARYIGRNFQNFFGKHFLNNY